MRRASATFIQPVCLDTDAETSIDLDKSVGTLKEQGQDSKKSNLTKSVFDVAIADVETSREEKEFSAYEAHLCQESKDWKKYIGEALADLKRAKENHVVVDWTILPKEKKEFIEKAPDLERFLRRMREFRCEAVKFIENDYADMLCRQENIALICKRQINLGKENFLEQQLATEENI